ncbi:MAG TPA: hypothetical protein PLU72_02465 [Candidatus Ozemobacteraceae bacterium]|nr:hypothetical protein [Candidatus Ozemobacteraceae bacterium]HQG27630.1 hypothetical protein [Candidatus Ozemobacteraceae bacterium]
MERRRNVKSRRGMAVAVVLFFAVSIMLFMYMLVGSNTNLSLQNKKTLGQLQAYYLAQSALQHVMLKLRFLPKETYEAFAAGATVPYPDVESDLHPQLRLTKPAGENWSLYASSVDDSSCPVEGKYQLTSIRLDSSLDGMSMVQDGYELEVTATVKGTGGLTHTDSVKEQIIISRFTGGIGP